MYVCDMYRDTILVIFSVNFQKKIFTNNEIFIYCVIHVQTIITLALQLISFLTELLQLEIHDVLC